MARVAGVFVLQPKPATASLEAVNLPCHSVWVGAVFASVKYAALEPNV